MKKISLAKALTLFGTAALMMGTMAGCGNSATEQSSVETTVAEIENEEVALADTFTSAPYFTKGVYVNYLDGAVTRDYFYVFYDEGAGYTEDGNNGMGLPYCCTQEDGKVTFSFGGDDGIEDVFTVESTEYGIIKGSFADGKTMYFEPVLDADPEAFDASEFVEKHGKIDLQKYEDPNGWSVTYNDADIDIATQDNMVAFVYTAPSAGTNMVMVTYDVDMSAKEAVDQLAESWGIEKTTVTESYFPGAEDIKGYWAMLQPSAEGSGYYAQAIARDYMDGYLLFDIIGHNSGDDEIDMAASDSLAIIIDSITFNS